MMSCPSSLQPWLQAPAAGAAQHGQRQKLGLKRTGRDTGAVFGAVHVSGELLLQYQEPFGDVMILL